MGAAHEHNEEFSPQLLVFQCFLTAVVFHLWSSPILQPIKIMVVLFHEMSHGLMAILSGGEVVEIVITPDEGGACETSGGIGLLIVSAGYLGSMFFGGLLLYLSKFRGSVPVVYTFLSLILAAAIFTVLEDPYPRTFATALAGCFIFLGLLAPAFLGVFFLRALGTVSCLYSIFDIYWDVLADDRPLHAVQNDAVAFADMTGIPASTVGLAWLVLSAGFFLVVLKSALTRGEGGPAPRAEPARAQ
jgi:hypothetical protein